MEALLEPLNMTEYNIDEKKLYSVNEVFDRIDNKFHYCPIKTMKNLFIV